MKQPERQPDNIFYGKIKFWLEDGVGMYCLPLNEKEEIIYAMKQNDMFLKEEASHALLAGILKNINL